MFSPQASTLDNTSRKWCSRAGALAVVFLSIMFVAFSIIAKYYNMALDMDAAVLTQSMQAVAVYDTCSNTKFNSEKINDTSFEIVWADTVLDKIYVHGADAWHVVGKTVTFESTDLCSRLIVWTLPQ